MKQWWQSLNQREQYLVQGGAVLVGLVLLWLWVWQPVTAYNGNLQTALANAIADNATLRKQQAAHPNGNDTAPDTSSNLQRAVGNVLKQYQLTGKNMSSEGNTITLKLEAAPFDPLVQFLATMERQYAAHTSATLTPAKGAGLVDADITLGR